MTALTEKCLRRVDFGKRGSCLSRKGRTHPEQNFIQERVLLKYTLSGKLTSGYLFMFQLRTFRAFIPKTSAMQNSRKNDTYHGQINTLVCVIGKEEMEDKEGNIGDRAADAFFSFSNIWFFGGVTPTADLV